MDFVYTFDELVPNTQTGGPSEDVCFIRLKMQLRDFFLAAATKEMVKKSLLVMAKFSL